MLYSQGTSPSSPGAISSITLVGSPKKASPEDTTLKCDRKSPTKAEHKSPTKDNDAAAAAITKDESIELVDQSDEDIKYKEEEQEKNKFKIDDKFKLSQKFSEVMSKILKLVLFYILLCIFCISFCCTYNLNQKLTHTIIFMFAI